VTKAEVQNQGRKWFW